MKLSVVTGTLNRLEHLRAMVDSVLASAGDLECELVIVDGGSADGTLAYLRERQSPTFRVIEQGQRLGAIKAFNAGFRASSGEYVANLNDDCVVVGDTLRLACAYLDDHPRVGQVAIPYNDGGSGPPKTQIIPNWLSRMWGRRDVPYANFGVVRRDLGERVGWWSDQLYQYAGDVRLSVEVILQGYEVVPLPGGHIIHHELHDGTRVPNIETHHLAVMYDPGRAWEHERRRNRRNAQDLERMRERAQRNPLMRVKGKRQEPMSNSVRLVYRGAHQTLATFAECPSGHIYRLNLAPDSMFYIDGRDVTWFLSRKEGPEPAFEIDGQ